MEISILDLRKALNVVLDHIVETRGVDKVDIAHSFYWHIPFDEQFDMSKDPKELDVGSLSDEWDFAHNLLDNSYPPIAYQLCQLAPLLDYVGHILSEKLAAEGG